jgi:hypothetical protein
VEDVQPASIEEAEQGALQILTTVLQLLAPVIAPADKRDEHLVEQLSFLQARETYGAFKLLLEHGEDVPAATLARALFEEAMRWAWVDEAPDERTAAFLGEAERAHAMIAEAAEAQGIDATMFFGPIVSEELLPASEGAPRFPRPFESLMDWMGDSAMHYLQYRLLSQYVHSSLLAAASTASERDGRLENARRLPLPARLTVIRNGTASMVLIFEETKHALVWPGPRGLNLVLAGFAHRMAAITYPFAPASS